MNSKTFKLKIINLEGEIIEKEVEALTFRNSLGEATILPNHQPIITVIEGEIEIKQNNKKEKIYLNLESLLEFRKNETKILILF
jgi:F-type H+-transporting ATPase subunit epsilon